MWKALNDGFSQPARQSVWAQSSMNANRTVTFTVFFVKATAAACVHWIDLSTHQNKIVFLYRRNPLQNTAVWLWHRGVCGQARIQKRFTFSIWNLFFQCSIVAPCDEPCSFISWSLVSRIAKNILSKLCSSKKRAEVHRAAKDVEK